MQQRMLNMINQFVTKQAIRLQLDGLILLLFILISLSSCEITKDRIIESTRKSCKAFVQTIEVSTLKQTQMSASSNQSAGFSNQPADIQEPTTIWSDIESGRTW